MEILSVTLTAGVRKAFRRAGRHFLVLSAVLPFDVWFYSALGGTAAEARGMRTALASELPFLEFDLLSSVDQTVEICVSDWRVTYSPPGSGGGGGGSSGGLTNAELRASAVPVSAAALTSIDSKLPALSGTGRVLVELPAGGSGLTNAELRASAVPVSGPATNAELRASALPVSAAALTSIDSKLPAALSVAGRLLVELPAGGSGLTDTELRASAVPVVADGLAKTNAGLQFAAGVTGSSTSACPVAFLKPGAKTVVVHGVMITCNIAGTHFVCFGVADGTVITAGTSAAAPNRKASGAASAAVCGTGTSVAGAPTVAECPGLSVPVAVVNQVVNANQYLPFDRPLVLSGTDRLYVTSPTGVNRTLRVGFVFEELP
jgi:hypothetical protein